MDEMKQTGEMAPHKRRIRYKGRYPRRFEEKYKELQPEKYGATVEKVMQGVFQLISQRTGLKFHFVTADSYEAAMSR